MKVAACLLGTQLVYSLHLSQLSRKLTGTRSGPVLEWRCRDGKSPFSTEARFQMPARLLW